MAASRSKPDLRFLRIAMIWIGNNIKNREEASVIRIRLPYGKGEIQAVVTDSCAVDEIRYQGQDPGDPTDWIEHALETPIGSSRLVELARGRRTAVILISDISRLCPSSLFLPGLLHELNSGGISDERILIVVALGMHRKQTPAEIERLVGPDIVGRVRILNHSALPEDCQFIGTTSIGTPVEINRFVVEADLRIATGNIEPHALAGMSGGVKALVPGVASQRCIEANHSLSQRYPVSPGNPDNPIRRDMEEVLQFLPVDFLFNVVVDHRREILAAVAGHPIEAHRAGVQKACQHFMVPVDRTYDTVIVSTGGYPKDMQLYQAVKTLTNASKIAKAGGRILLCARCEELFGNGVFQYWVETIQDRERIVRMLHDHFVLGAHKVEHIDRVLRKNKVYLYSDVPDSTAELLGFHPVRDLQETVQQLSGKSHAMAYMPFGAITFPVIKSNL